MSETFVSNGARLSLTQRGTGLPVIFLHPTPIDHAYWLPLIDELAGVRAILPDLRGHGKSQLGESLPVGLFQRVPDAPALTMDQLATDTVALLDHLQLREAVFVGCSIGGYVMLELWRRAAERMLGLGIICSKPQPDLEANLAKRTSTIAEARNQGTAGIFDGMAQTLIGATARQRRPAIEQELRSLMTITPDALIAVQAGLATRPDSIPTVATITAPVFTLAGGEDPGVTPAEMDTYQAAPGGCEAHLLPDAGHYAAYEQPQKVASLLAEWLRQLDT
jgi:pimeloyl-ACP methyl ester carboxylesterase